MRHWGASPDPTRVVEYFSHEASGYHTRSTRFPWAWARVCESTAIRSLLGNIAGIEVLELGAGSGYYTCELIRSGARHVWAVDLSDAMLAALPKSTVTPIVGDAETICLDKRFPVLLSAGMLEFVRDPVAVLVNAARHAEPGGRLVLLAPQASALGCVYRWFHHRHGIDIHLFDRTWFETMAPRSGWQVHAVVRVLPFSLVVRLHRV